MSPSAEEEDEGEREGFLDYTTATVWESFCAEVESRLRSWQRGEETSATENVDGDEVVVSVLETRLPHFRPEKYSLALHYPAEGHYVSEWLSLGDGQPFVLLYPNSFSGCVLDAEESVALLSALSSAALSTSFPHALLVPERDRQRRAFSGIQLRSKGHVARLQTDCITGSLKASEMHTLSRVSDYHVTSTLSSVLGPWMLTAARESSTATMTRDFDLSWTLPESQDGSDLMCLWMNDWNSACPWYPWAEYEDPVDSVRLALAWEDLPLAQAQEDLDKFSRARDAGFASSRGGGRAFGIESLHDLRKVGGALVRIGLNGDIVNDAMWQRPVLETMKRTSGGYFFAQMVSRFHANFQIVERAKGMSQLSSDSFWDDHDVTPQAPTTKLLETQIESIFNRRAFVQNMGSLENDLHSLPSDNLLDYLAMHTLSYGDNPRAIAMLWRRFVGELRLCHWEPRDLLPRTSAKMEIDLGASIIEQKVQLINLCIFCLRTLGAQASQGQASGGLTQVFREETGMDANPSMVTKDVLGEYDYMLSVTGNKKNRREVWMKLHGRFVGNLAAAFRREHPSASFADFRRHFEATKYYRKFSKLSQSLGPALNGFTKDRLKDLWQQTRRRNGSNGGSGGGGDDDDMRGALCSRAEMALDWLEQIPPIDLFKSLYTLGVSNVARIMGLSRTSRLRPVGDLLQVLREGLGEWLNDLPRKLATTDLENDGAAAGICQDLHMVEVAMAFAESVVQKMVFLSSDVQTFLVDAFCERVATKAFAEMERPAIEMVVDLPFFCAQTRGTELMGLHLRKQVVKISTGRGAGEDEGGGSEDEPWFYTYLCQDLDHSITRFASIVTV